jgi:hypothetical protein
LFNVPDGAGGRRLSVSIRGRFCQNIYENNTRRRSIPDFDGGRFDRATRRFRGLVGERRRLLCDERFPGKLVGDTFILDAVVDGDAIDLLLCGAYFERCSQTLTVFAAHVVRGGGWSFAGDSRDRFGVLGGEGVAFDEWRGILNLPSL